MTAKPKITVVATLDQIDLRKVLSQGLFLRGVVKEYRLANGEAVAYTNKAHTRWRLVLKVNGLTLMCQPEVDDRTKLSIYLRISEALAAVAATDAVVVIDRLCDYTKERTRRYKKRYKKEG
jgi:hypothetical protein